MADRKHVIKTADMSEEMISEAIDCASHALDQFSKENEQAGHIKRQFDKKFNSTWHCIVGKDFSSAVTFESKRMIYFYMGLISILLWKSG